MHVTKGGEKETLERLFYILLTSLSDRWVHVLKSIVFARMVDVTNVIVDALRWINDSVNDNADTGNAITLHRKVVTTISKWIYV